MITLTLTPDRATASVLVDVRVTGSFDPARFTLTRTDANGVAAVRLATGQTIAPGALIIRDSEAALTGPVAYTAAFAGGESIAKLTALDVVGAVLSLPVQPQVRAAVGGVDYDARRTSRSTVHEPIGRPDPVVTIGRLAYRRGTLRFLAVDRDAADRVAAVYERREIALLRLDGRPVADLYHVVEEVGETQAVEGGAGWIVEVRYVEVARPTAALVGALGWSYADVAALGSYLTVRATFPNYADLAVGARP